MKTKSALSYFESGADFSPCENYRYSLLRRWGCNGKQNQVMFIGLNPSKADERVDDPTIRRCVNFAKAWGYSGVIMTNAYAYRETNPMAMKAAPNPIGPGNDAAIIRCRDQVGLIVAAWGNHCNPSRALHVCNLINRPIKCLGKNQNGSPKHPLYLKCDTKLKQFWEPS